MLITYTTTITMAYDFYKTIIWGFSYKFLSGSDPKLSNNILIMMSFMMNTIVGGLMTAFLKFHVMLATSNKTTIENLDKLGKPF